MIRHESPEVTAMGTASTTNTSSNRPISQWCPYCAATTTSVLCDGCKFEICTICDYPCDCMRRTGTSRQCAHCEDVFPEYQGRSWRDLWFCSPGCHREWVEQAADPYNPE